MSMTIDFSDFEKGLMKLVKEVEPKETAKGLFMAANQLLRDAIGEPHFAPFHVKDMEDPNDKLGGALRASASTQAPDGVMRLATKSVPASVGSGNEMVAGFNIVYAARWHELTPAEDEKIKWTLRTASGRAGRKYLESKMAKFKETYMKIVALHLKRVLDKGGNNV
jgi:hypothetical protein